MAIACVPELEGEVWMFAVSSALICQQQTAPLVAFYQLFDVYAWELICVCVRERKREREREEKVKIHKKEREK